MAGPQGVSTRWAWRKASPGGIKRLTGNSRSALEEVDSGADTVAPIVAPGPDPAMESPVSVYTYDGQRVTLWFTLQAFSSGWTNGASGRF